MRSSIIPHVQPASAGTQPRQVGEQPCFEIKEGGAVTSGTAAPYCSVMVQDEEGLLRDGANGDGSPGSSFLISDCHFARVSCGKDGEL